MAAIRKKERINENTFLIDTVHEGVRGGYSVYLIKSSDGRHCLIDGGTKPSAPLIYNRLKELGGWPVQKIVVTHSHWDHTQGIAYLREQAARTGDHIDVLASEKALPYLKDQSYNVCFGSDQDPFLNVEDIIPLNDGDRVEAGRGISLTIIDTPGHMEDHISILDRQSKNLFVGDAIGTKWADEFMLCNANSPYWDEDAFFKSIERLRTIEFETVSLSHFGCITGDEAGQLLEESVDVYRRWMAVFSENRAKIDDVDFIIDRLWERCYAHITGRYKEVLRPTMIDSVRMVAGSYKLRQQVSNA
jgi:glyoxylase-like metal-dependent hydrolase (beta-lactamase superfamily II)